MDGDQAPPPEFDPNAPLVRFVLGVAELFYGEPGDGAPERRPEEIKAEADRLLMDVVPEPPRPAGRPAEELATETAEAAWEALEAGRQDAEELALTALRYWPDCAEAYSLLGIAAGEQLELALPLFTLAVMAGAAALGPDGFERYAGRFWEAPETRPLMAALALLARANREAGAADTAAAHYFEMLNLNPSDDQGVRYDLLALSLENGKQETAARVIEAFADDESAAFAYGRALFEFQRGGDSDPARLALRAARARNAHVVDFLLGTKPLPERLEPSSEAGGETEAVFIADQFARAWETTRGAREWLRRHTVPAQPGAPAKAKRTGPREI